MKIGRQNLQDLFAPQIAFCLGDCGDVTPRLPDDDYVVITDPPYTIRTAEQCNEMLKRLGLVEFDALVLTNPENGYIWRGEKHFLPQLAPQRTAAHPNQRPVDEMAKLVAMTRRPCALCQDRVVLDPYAGCGTTLLAAMKVGRRAIGIDREMAYWLRFCEVCATFGRRVTVSF